MLDEVTAALTSLAGDGTFATALKCGGETLAITVKGVGPLTFPISATQAKRLCALAQPAPFGKRDQTLHDDRVRNTWEIAASKVKIDQRRWLASLRPQLQLIKQRLGLPVKGKLDLKLDKLLVYQRGQFFVTHQDSERSDTMIGSLIVVLPSEHTGGSIIVEHGGTRKSFGRSAGTAKKELGLIAFYADCQHEVRPVKSGYRVVLAYHVLYEEADLSLAPTSPPASIKRLSDAVASYFATPAPVNSWSKDPPERPDRLVYLLDHEYTQKSLHWSRLKRLDRERVGALRQVAEDLDCEARLALVDIHESWQTDGDDDWGYGYGSRGRRFRGDDDDHDVDRDPADFELTDLLDTDVEIRHWIGLDGQAARGAGGPVLHDLEVCCTTASVKLKPYKAEHEGYMGNYGNTVDRWYHRAAAVLWPRERTFVMHAKASPGWAIDQALRAKALETVRARVDSILPFWPRHAEQAVGAKSFAKVVKAARRVDDPGRAAGLLGPFGHHRLSLASTADFVALVERYGLAWSQDLFRSWTKNARWDTPPWLPFLPTFCRALGNGESEHRRGLASWVLGEEIARLKERHLKLTRRSVGLHLQSRLGALGEEAIVLLEGATLADDPAAHGEIVGFLTSREAGIPLMALGEILKTCRTSRALADVRELRLYEAYEHVVRGLEQAVARPPRDGADWSIEPPAGCRCAQCAVLAEFLRDQSRIEHSWRLAEEGRSHIAGVIRSHGLPVSHTTIRRGSPYTLLLKKEKTLFRQETELRARQKGLLAWLVKERRTFAAT